MEKVELKVETKGNKKDKQNKDTLLQSDVSALFFALGILCFLLFLLLRYTISSVETLDLTYALAVLSAIMSSLLYGTLAMCWCGFVIMHAP